MLSGARRRVNAKVAVAWGVRRPWKIVPVACGVLVFWCDGVLCTVLCISEAIDARPFHSPIVPPCAFPNQRTVVVHDDVHSQFSAPNKNDLWYRTLSMLCYTVFFFLDHSNLKIKEW